MSAVTGPHGAPDTDAIRDYIRVELCDDASLSIGYDEDLLLSGILDSLSVMRLVAHLEDRYGQAIPPEDVTIENFGTLRQIENYLVARSGASG